MTNVIFLDIDGPMLPSRAWIMHPERKETLFASWDPVAVRLINHLFQDAHAKLVVSSTWAGLGKNEFIYHMGKNGMEYVKKYHSKAEPNSGFIKQLKQLQKNMGYNSLHERT